MTRAVPPSVVETVDAYASAAFRGSFEDRLNAQATLLAAIADAIEAARCEADHFEECYLEQVLLVDKMTERAAAAERQRAVTDHDAARLAEIRANRPGADMADETVEFLLRLLATAETQLVAAHGLLARAEAAERERE